MTINNTLWYCIESVQGLIVKTTRCSFATLSTLVAGLLIASGAHAIEPEAAVAPTLSQEPAIVEPTSEPDDLANVSAPDTKADTPKIEIDLSNVRDLRSLIDEARMRAQINYLAEKLRQPAETLEQYVQLAWAEAAQREGMRPELLIAIMEKESTFRPKIQSRYGAQGLMQVVPRWHRDKLKGSESLFSPEVNVRVGTDILEEYLEHAEGDLAKALAKYSGNASGYAKKVLSASRKLARVADMAELQVAMAPDLFTEVEQAG